MPLQGQGGEYRDFFHSFLHLILAKRLLAGRAGFCNLARREGLADREQQYVAGMAVRGLRRVRDACSNCLQVGSD
jgi:hypothetical protein